jgi:hypothetical protein
MRRARQDAADSEFSWVVVRLNLVSMAHQVSETLDFSVHSACLLAQKFTDSALLPMQ